MEQQMISGTPLSCFQHGELARCSHRKSNTEAELVTHAAIGADSLVRLILVDRIATATRLGLEREAYMELTTRYHQINAFH